ncbi:MAG: hypothetical protein U0527_17100 [Candidatus Eisenbacteria bacterium]
MAATRSPPASQNHQRSGPSDTTPLTPRRNERSRAFAGPPFALFLRSASSRLPTRTGVAFEFATSVSSAPRTQSSGSGGNSKRPGAKSVTFTSWVKSARPARFARTIGSADKTTNGPMLSAICGKRSVAAFGASASIRSEMGSPTVIESGASVTLKRSSADGAREA